MKIIKEKIQLKELMALAGEKFGNLVKAVVDIEKEIMAIDAELHADEEALLLSTGSKQENLWGINIYPELSQEDFVEFDSMINIRPAQNNRSRGIDDLKTKEKIITIINKLINK